MKPMDSPMAGKVDNSWPCQRCGSALDGGLHRRGDLRVCESCYIDTWQPHHRKPHWCYLGSIKSDYLRSASSD